MAGIQSESFYYTFKNVSVVSQSSTTNFLEINGDSSLQKDTYLQTVYLPGKDTIKVKGEYTAPDYGFPRADGIINV